MGELLTLRLRRGELVRNAAGHAEWQTLHTAKSVPPDRTTIIICDMWDNHWSRGAVVREEAMLPRMIAVLTAARAKGVHIIHAPSETMAFYADEPARQRMLNIPQVEPPPDRDHAVPPLPIDASDHGSDTGEPESYKAWSRQHPAIEIDQSRDLISDNGREIYSYLAARQIEQLLIMGVHTNMCILNRFVCHQNRWSSG
ncbi:MAG: cysteine hydrolase, partial [Caldilineaceae bacterium]|nr:cysteine hydrolase [Caldilineaceae bacterium]